MAVERSGESMSTPASKRTRRALAVMIVLGVLMAAGGLLLGSTANAGQGQAADRNQVVAKANDFAIAYNTYDVSNLADYQERIVGLLTPKYNEQFVEVTDAIFGALEDKKQRSGDAKLVGAAIESIGDDSASVIVAVDAAITNTDTKVAVPRHFRWKLSFTKSDDRWLVSNFESVASAEATTHE